MAWYLDTSAFLKLLAEENDSAAMREWAVLHDSLWSSQLLRTEAVRAASRLGISDDDVETALESVSLILPSVATFYTAGHLAPHSLRSLDALHLATALEMGDDLEGIVAYDERLITASRDASLVVVSPA
ncbi:MAG: type II toxin-antitoxin system VapC family toxin [Actinomycetota bacterium]|jgi:predicted nucleic acid-binding protein|nr:type II toxin-antitoxin system VapC family toxin [Actinomycetota bacterium]